MKNQLINLFAFIGIITCIALACSVSDDELTDDEPINPNPQTTETNDYGKYQFSSVYAGSFAIAVLNTETGVMKSYESNNSCDCWVENNSLAPITFTH